MPDSPFTTIGDEALEARIVAWVLGEASAFEAAELERLCYERPELMVFKRRMLALHGLLAEAEKPDQSWKLPPEKRRAVEDVLGESEVVRLEIAREKRVRHSGRRALLAIAACLILTIIVAGLMAPASIQKARKILPLNHAESAPALVGKDRERYLHELRKTIRDQEDKVAERSKVLATVEKNRSGFQDSPKEEAIKRGLDAQDIVDARRDLESDKELLQQMKLKFVDEEISDRISKAELASNSPAGMMRLETTIPPERIEGTPKPIILPGQTSSGNSELADARVMEKQKQAHLDQNEPAASSAPVTETGAISGSIAQRELLAHSGSGSLTLSRDNASGSGSGYGGGGGFARPMEESASVDAFAATDSLDDKASPVEYNLRRAARPRVRADSAFAPGQPMPAAQPAPASELAAADESIRELQKKAPALDGLRSDNTWELSGANTYAGQTSLSGGKLGIASSSSRLESGKESAKDADAGSFNEAIPATPAAPEAEAPADRPALLAEGQAKRRLYSTRAGETNEYLFRGASLDKEDAQLPDDPAALAKAVRDQEDKVEGRRKALATIVRNKGIIYKGSDSFYDQGGVDEDQGARNALQTYHEMEQEKLQLESQISSLLKYDSDQLMIYAAGVNLPDNIIRELYPKYQETKRQLDGLKISGLSDRHPTVQATVDQVEKMKRQLDEGVVNLRATLQAQLDLANNRLKKIEPRINETREEAIKRGLDAADYVDAKQDFETDQRLLQVMKLKLKLAESPEPKTEAPKPDLTKLMEEIPASEEPYSTFSLNVSDASFRVAQAALAKGEQPDPAGIKVEQFYNAVDYGDPAPAADEPVACTIEQGVHPVIPGRNLVRVALKTAAAGRSAAQPLRLTLLVDQSGSMARDDRRAAMDKALGGLAGLLTKNDLVTVIGFSRTPRLLADVMSGDQAGKLADVINQAASEGGTNLEEAMKLADQLSIRHKQEGAQNRIVLFTDGAANLGDANPERLAQKVKQLRQKGIAFDIAGIAADDLNDALLGELARNGNGRYYVVGRNGDENFAKQLAGAFRPAAENVKVQVRFNPERVVRYKLIGFEKDRLKTEDFRNDKVDAAELAAEEAGVAIYQVEPKAEGHGEIGEVSVRFRDTASGEMVERSWTIPHDGGVPAIDRAMPSMQLATLAMLAGEKLKGGPLAAAIDFKQLTAPAANVKQLYGNTGRVGEVLRMVDTLK